MCSLRQLKTYYEEAVWVSFSATLSSIPMFYKLLIDKRNLLLKVHQSIVSRRRIVV